MKYHVSNEKPIDLHHLSPDDYIEYLIIRYIV